MLYLVSVFCCLIPYVNCFRVWVPFAIFSGFLFWVLCRPCFDIWMMDNKLQKAGLALLLLMHSLIFRDITPLSVTWAWQSYTSSGWPTRTPLILTTTRTRNSLTPSRNEAGVKELLPPSFPPFSASRTETAALPVARQLVHSSFGTVKVPDVITVQPAGKVPTHARTRTHTYIHTHTGSDRYYCRITGWTAALPDHMQSTIELQTWKTPLKWLLNPRIIWWL